MSNYIHIALGDAARGSLWWCLNKSENKNHKYYGEVRNFREDLSTGNIERIEDNLFERVKWLQTLYGEIENLESIKKIERDILKAYHLELNILKDQKIIIWHGHNVVEQISLMYLVNRFKGNEIYEVPISKIIEKTVGEKNYNVKFTGECGPKEVQKALDKISYINENRKNELIENWNELKKQKGSLRIIKDKKIVTIEEDYFDKEILKCVDNEFKFAAKIIGDVVRNLDENISDTFINYRLRKLIKNGKLEYKGIMKSIRDFEVKKK